MSASRSKAFDLSRRLVAVAAIVLALVATANSTPTPTPTPTATPITGAVSGNATATPSVDSGVSGTGTGANTFLVGNEPAQTVSTSPTVPQFLISLVAIQGTGTLHGTPASAAFFSLPTTPGPWTSLGDWACSSADGDIHMAAAYRQGDATDGPGVNLTWSFFQDAGETTPEAFFASQVNMVFIRNVNSSAPPPPIDVIGTPTCANDAAGPISYDASGITTVTPNDVIVALSGASGNPLQNQTVGLFSGNPLLTLALQPNAGYGPALQPAYNYSTNISAPIGLSGAAGTYGPVSNPFTFMTSSGPGEAVVVLVGLKSPPTPTPTPTPTATSTATPTPTPTATPAAIVTGTPIRITRAPGSTVSGGTFQVCNTRGGQMTTSSVTISFNNADLFTTATLTGTQGANTVTATVNPITGGDSPEHANNTVFDFSPLSIPPGACASFSLSVTITNNPDISMRRTPVVYASLIAGSERGPNLSAFALLLLCAVGLGGARRRRTMIAVILILAALATQIGCDTGGLPSSLSSENQQPQSTQTVVKVAVAIQTGAAVPVSGLPVKISTVLTQP